MPTVTIYLLFDEDASYHEVKFFSNILNYLKSISSSKVTLFCLDIALFINITNFLTFSLVTLIFGVNIIPRIDIH